MGQAIASVPRLTHVPLVPPQNQNKAGGALSLFAHLLYVYLAGVPPTSPQAPGFMIDMRRGLQKHNIDNTQPEPTPRLPIAETGRWWALFPPLSSFYTESAVELFGPDVTGGH